MIGLFYINKTKRYRLMFYTYLPQQLTDILQYLTFRRFAPLSSTDDWLPRYQFLLPFFIFNLEVEVETGNRNLLNMRPEPLRVKPSMQKVSGLILTVTINI
jgi:hypothetical protein